MSTGDKHMHLADKLTVKTPKMILTFGGLRAVVYPVLPGEDGYEEESHSETFHVESIWLASKSTILDNQQKEILNSFNQGTKIIEFPKDRFTVNNIWDKRPTPVKKPMKDYSGYTIIPLGR